MICDETCDIGEILYRFHVRLLHGDTEFNVDMAAMYALQPRPALNPHDTSARSQMLPSDGRYGTRARWFCKLQPYVTLSR